MPMTFQIENGGIRCGERYCLISKDEELRLLGAGNAGPGPAWDKEHSVGTNEGHDERSVLCAMYVTPVMCMHSTHKLDPCLGEGGKRRGEISASTGHSCRGRDEMRKSWDEREMRSKAQTQTVCAGHRSCHLHAAG